jgi:hypothetical protein
LSVTDNDKGFHRVLAALGALGGVSLGIQGAEAGRAHPASPGITLADLGAIHELGLGVPERSWLRSWVDANQNQIFEDCTLAMQRVILLQLTKDQALELLALKWQGELQAWISGGNVSPPLAETTVERKGSSVPLVDTGALRSAITALATKALK